MKSYNHLFEKLVSYENIESAIFRSAKKKTKRKDVANILTNKDKYIKKIQDFLISGGFKAQKHKLTKKYDKSSHKDRFIVQPYYHKNSNGEEVFEHIIHHAVIQVLQPVFMKGMYEFSCGSIPNRGGHYGKRYIDKYIREHNNQAIKYCCKFDVHHFYMEVDIDILKKKFTEKIHDSKMLDVIFSILDSNMALYDDGWAAVGLPIGFYTSQWFANWFLQDFDHFIKEELKIKCFVRYVDDVVLFSSNKKELHKSFRKIKEFLETLNLDIKGNYQVFKFDYGGNSGRAIDFMGFKFYRDRTTLRKSIIKNAEKKARRISKKEVPTYYDASQMLSYIGWFKSTKTFEFFNNHILSLVNFRILKLLISRKAKEELK